jgi:hypothetical protein
MFITFDTGASQEDVVMVCIKGGVGNYFQSLFILIKNVDCGILRFLHARGSVCITSFFS